MMGTVWSNIWQRVVLTSAIIIVIAVVFAGLVGIKPVHAASPLAPPENLTAIAISPTSVYLTWQDKSNNEIKFIIERKTGKSSYFTVNIVGSNVTSYTDTGLNPDAVYHYRVMAHGSAGDSAYSNEVSVSALSSPMSSPVLLSPVNGSIVTTLTPQMKWVPSEDEVIYTLQVSRYSNFSDLLINKAGLNEANYSIPLYILKWNSSYYVRVKSQNEAGVSSEWSARSYFRVFPRSFGIHYCNCH